MMHPAPMAGVRITLVNSRRVIDFVLPRRIATRVAAFSTIKNRGETRGTWSGSGDAELLRNLSKKEVRLSDNYSALGSHILDK